MGNGQPTSSVEYPACQQTRKTGNEPFVGPTGQLPFAVVDFWRWAVSDLIENTTRGLLAEFLVGQALGATNTLRCGWDAFDLRTSNGLKIEVKSCAYLQAWDQRKLSRI